MLFLLLLPLEVLAMGFDCLTGKIPNPLIAGGLLIGLAYRWSAGGLPGIRSFLLGALLPVLVLGVLHYFRMLGAGDIKLLMVIGGFLGPAKGLYSIWFSFLIAGIWSLAILGKRRILAQRLQYFLQYIREYRKSRKWKPYIDRTENPAYLHFSVPICLGSLCVMGGFL